MCNNALSSTQGLCNLLVKVIPLYKKNNGEKLEYSLVDTVSNP